jgi:pyruvate,water dikinase
MNTPAPASGLYVLSLADSRATLQTVGGKGASLARLVTAGFPVPAGFHVTTAAYDQFVHANRLMPPILHALAAADSRDPATLERASERIRVCFVGASVPDPITRAIAGAYAQLGGERAVAVRSSATAEDLPGLSFAGQHETFLNVRGVDAVLDRVKRCWSSLWTARAIGYRAAHGIDTSGLHLAVVVQALVAADAAGVVFTADPVTGRPDRAILTASLGLGEAIVGGEVTPDSLTLDKRTRQVLSREIGDKRVMTLPTPHGTELGAVPEAQRRVPVLDDAAAADLLAMCLRIEELYGLPVDVEWARAEGVFNIVQARPITALREPAASPPTEWPLPHANSSYIRSSIIELLPDPLTPLFATLGARAINAGYERLAARLFGIRTLPHDLFMCINGYAYYDFRFTAGIVARFLLSSYKFPGLLLSAERRWREMCARDRFAVERWRDRDVEGMSATELWRGVGELLESGIDHYTSIQSGVLPAAFESEAIFSQFYERVIKREGDPASLTFLLGLDSAPIRAEKSLWDLAEWCRARSDLAASLSSTPADKLAADLAASQSGLQDARPADWSEWRRRMRRHLCDYGHAIYDLDFAKPLAADDPRPLLQTLVFFMSGRGRNPHERQRAAAREREAAMRAVQSRLGGLRRRVFRRLASWAQKYAPLREDGLFHIGLGWPLVRRFLLELGRRLSLPYGPAAGSGVIETADDIFWLGQEEIEAALAALERGARPVDLRAEVRDRKRTWEAARRVTPPPVLPPRRKWLGMDLEKWLPVRVEGQEGNVITGIGVSPGQVSARARVLHTPEDFGQMVHGDVLVAAITTPAWTPLFALASGVVTDVGGPLSHGSIVAREYGIPAVLGTGVATRRIQSDQWLVVDGTVGRVTLS